MIQYLSENKVFHIQTKNTSYVMKLYPTLHLGHLYYGDVLSEKQDFQALEIGFDIEVGNQVIYDETDKTFNLNQAFLEMSTYGKGDFRDPMLHLRFGDGSRLSDFVYQSHQIIAGKPHFPEMPQTNFSDEPTQETLVITLVDQARKLSCDLYYTPFIMQDTIARRMVLRNNSDELVVIEKAMSMGLDMLNQDYEAYSFDGAWIRERQITQHPLRYGILKFDSKKGVSSNDHNPYVVVKQKHTDEVNGNCYGFSLIYSGNFETTLEVSPHNIVRVLMGINSFDFFMDLEPNGHFVTPEVLLSFSKNGLSRLSQNLHETVKKNIIPKHWQNKSRPILINNWEATYFDFNEKKLIKLAKEAKKLGIELFVLDDGWFGKRNDDTSGLGDWVVNRKKLPSGITGLAKKINTIGLDFGIWVEPEMVNPDSTLYREHPEWAVKHPLFKESYGRNQLVLDLTNQEVRTYIIDAMDKLFRSANITYCKWDMNRNFSDVYSSKLPVSSQGAFFHLYTLGLYEILETLTSRFPNILFESCASGGNRFDLGMLYYMPQTWTSDNTDGYERLKIQYGTSYCYPPSTMGAHVSQIPNQQTLRQVPLESRFNTAIFGLLGYELDLTELTPYEKKVVKKQIEYYKEHRDLLQFGTFYRYQSPFEGNDTIWSSVSEDQNEAIVGVYKTLALPNQGLEKIVISGLKDDQLYEITVREEYFNLSFFKGLVKHALPIKLNSNGILFHLLQNRYLMKKETEQIRSYGKTLNQFGFVPKQNFIGSGYNESIRLMGDFGSRIYYIKAIEEA